MPSITVSYRDLIGLLGRRIEPDRLCERLSMCGMEAALEGDDVKIEIAHNRPDLLSPEGVARAMRGFLHIETGLPRYNARPSGISLEVDPSVHTIRPFIAAGVVLGVKMNDSLIASLMQAQDKLDGLLGRKRRKGSTGLHDLCAFTPPVRYTTTSPAGVRFVPLDFGREATPEEILREHPKGTEYGSIIKDLPRYPLLTDSRGEVLSMPPIINGEMTRVTEKTKGFFIDVTGEDERVVNQTLTIMMTGLAERGFKLRTVAVRYPGRSSVTPNLRPRRLRLDPETAGRIIGIKVGTRQAIRLAEAMRYGAARAAKDSLTILIPTYRTDVMHETDVIEDIAIANGYDNLGPAPPKVLTTGEEAPIEKTSDKARSVLTGLGFMEVMTYTLTNPHINFELMRTAGEAAVVANPVSEEYTILRDSLLPSLLSVLSRNRHNPLPQRIFEIGDVVVLDEESETGARNVRRAAAAVIGEGFGFTYVKAAAEALLRELRGAWDTRGTWHPSFIDGRVAEFRSADETVGIVGEIHPEVILGFELENPVAVFEVNLN